MKPGVEYRTTQRYLGKPKYAKVVNFGSLPNGTNKAVSGWAENVQYVAGHSIMLTNGADVTGPWVGISNVFISASAIEIAANGDQSQYSTHVAVYYTKTTD